MKQHNWLHMSIRFVVIIQFLFSLVFPAGALAAAGAAGPLQGQVDVTAQTAAVESPALTGSSPLAPSAAALQVTILSSPSLVVDSNGGAIQPRVFVVEARVTNTGDTAAEDVSLTLNYSNIPSGWMLLSGEDSSRQVGTLAPGASYHGYWFGTYPQTIGSSYTYSVIATASNIGAPATANTTATTISVVSAANSGITQVAFDVTVGVEFFVDIDYKLSNNAHTAHFSPVGNLDFKPGAYRLLSSTIYLYDANNALLATYADRVYLAAGEIPVGAVNATAVFSFLALQAENTRLCSYAMIGYNSGYKYDINYCDPTSGGVIDINGSISLDFKKVANRLAVEQGELITYTLNYTNTGELPLKYVWLWVAYNPSLVAANTYSPAPKAPETIDGRAVWYIGDVPPGANGSVMFDVLVDGNGADILDATPIVNNGYFGVTPGELPAAPALTRTVTTTLNAPAFTFTKTDGKTSIVAGETGTYTLSLTNNGHATAQVATLVDTLPAGVTAGAATPPADTINGQTLTWNLGPILPGATRSIEIPYTVDITTPNGTLLTNQATFDYSNPAGHHFTQMARSDTTTVQNAVMTISKTDSPDPVLANHNLLYTLNYQNSGPAPATNVVIRDTLPISTTFTSCTGGCALVNGQYTWDIGTVAANSSGSVTFTVTVNDVPKNTIITNGDYSLTSNQSGTVTGPATTTTTQRDAAIFNVHAYHDTNGNGAYDAGTDAVIAGVIMTMTQAVTPTLITNSNGLARFRVETSGLVTILAEEPNGYIHATPNNLITEAVLGTTTDVYFGYISTTEAFAIIFGTVYEDANHNGLYDPGEVGIPGATVASPQAAAPASVITGAYGWYTLRFDDEGTATITETNAPGYVSTTTDFKSASIIIPSNNSSPYDFGDFAGVKITGKVFNDLNTNGADDSEGGLAGVAVSAGLESTQTDANGLYTLYLAVPPTDPITISETQPEGYASTNAIPGTGVSKVDNNTLSIASPVAGTTYADNKFGDAALVDIVTIQGFVWNDNGAGGGIIANGLREADEPGLAGATVSITGGLSTTSAADGSFTLYGPANTPLTLTETNPGGYESTNAIPGANASKVDNDTLLIAPVAAGLTTSGHLFGDVLPTGLAVVSGFVYDDANENALKDGETGLAGIPVTLEFEDGHTIEIPSEADGSYMFLVNPGENLLVRTAGPGGPFYPTSPTSYYFTAASATTYPDVNFGFSDDQDAAVIFGVVFDDMNSNGERDFGEPGLGGAQVTLDGVTDYPTTGTGIIAGAYHFTITSSTGLHEVKETIHPAGYRSTTPDVLNIFIVPGNSYPADFGDTNSQDHATIYGVVFDDFDQDSLRDIGEPGLGGVAITITTGTGEISMLTKSYGQFSYGFEVQDEGYHTVFSEDPAKPGYHSTTPDSVNLFMELNNSYQIDFGDAQNGNTAMILGTVFQDDNGDGDQDSSELGISGVTVNLYGGKTTITNAYGWYSFLVTAQGLYEVTEVDKAGYYSTTPNQVTVDVADWTNYYVNFGDLNNPNVTVFYGTVFEDLNVNGARNTGELGLAGVTIKMTNGITTTRQTNAWGQYSFLIDEAGTYTIQEQDLSGYVSTNAIPGSAGVLKVDANTFSTVLDETDFGQALPDNLFGDALASQVITISGAVFNDNGAVGGIIGDGQRNGSEPGLAGATVTLSTGLSQVTGADGAFSIFAPDNTEVTVLETNPGGYISTGAVAGNDATVDNFDQITVAALPGTSVSAGNLFGDLSPTSFAVITGFVFDDADEDGIMDAGEAGFAGVDVTMEVLNGATVVHSTDPTGKYQFALATGSTARITSAGPADLAYYPTTPESLIVSPVTTGLHEGNNFGYSNDTDSYALFGTVFDDFNSNGIQDAGEDGLENVLITLSSGPTTLTDGLGRYTFGLTAPISSYLGVTETDPAGYRSTTPNTVIVPVSAAVHAYQVDFGDTNRQDATSIFGAVFEDENVNGLWDLGEFGIPGVKVTLGDGITPQEVNTNQWGQFTFMVEAADTYQLVETDPGGYISTNAIPGGPAVTKLNNNNLEVTVAAMGESIGNNLFGDALANTAVAVSGMVWEDLDGDGTKDAQEPGLANAKVSLSTGLSQMTGANGLYLLYAPANTAVLITEEDPTGYFSTNAIPGNNASKVTNNKIQVNDQITGGGTSTGNNFGDTYLADAGVIYGYVFDDKNGNGLFDGADTGIPGVTLTLDGVTTTTSASDGYYQFVVTVEGVYTVVETDLPAYFSITPNTVHVSVAIGNSYPVDFADALKQDATFAIVNGTVFNDLNGNGVYDAAETGLPGVSVKLDGTAAATTGTYGSYFIKVDATGPHAIEQTNLPDYISTTPDLLVIDVAAFGETYTADFGDVLKGSANFAVIYGTVFNDLDGDGVRDANELGLAGVTVTLDGTTPAVTNNLGAYTFKVITTGVHTVVETQPANYFSTTPNEVHVTVAFANSYRVNFGDAVNSSGFGVIYGIVFDDLDFDAVWDANEPGLSGVNVTLDNNASPATTNDFGMFVFGVAAGPHKVTETDPAGYLSSTPNLVNVTIANGEGKLVTFGDFVPCTIVKDSHEEDDTDATAKPIAGFGSANTYNFSDDASDWFTFSAEAHATYTITVKATGQRTDSVVTVYVKDAFDNLVVVAVNDDVEDTTDFSSEVVFKAYMNKTYYIHVANRNSLQGCRTDYELKVEETPSPIKYLFLPLIAKDFGAPADAPLAAPASGLSLPAAPSVATDILSPNGPESPEGVIEHMCLDTYELDDTWELAKEIQAGDIQLHSFDSNTALYAADKDHFWFAAELLDQVSFTITPVANTLTKIELYDADRNWIKTGTTTLSWTATKDGNYYLIISPTNDAFGCSDVAGYSLSMTEIPVSKLYLPLVSR